MATQPPNSEDEIATAKRVQNRAFKLFGGIGLAGGIAGFSPSVFKLLTSVVSFLILFTHVDIDSFVVPVLISSC